MADALTFSALSAAITKVDEQRYPSVSLASIDMLCLRLAAEFEKGLADGTLKEEDLAPWTRRKMAEAFGTEPIETERIPIPRPLEQTERERGKWKRRR